MATDRGCRILSWPHYRIFSEDIMKSIICAVLLYAFTSIASAQIIIVQTPDGGQQGCIVLKGFISCQ